MNESNFNNVSIEPKKKNNVMVIGVILIALILCGIGGYFIFASKDSSSGTPETPEKPTDKKEEDYASKYEGIYLAKETKMYIHKKSNNSFYYVIGGNFIGTATVNGEMAKEDNHFDDYFEFKLVENGIELIYHPKEENGTVAADTGLYNKVAEYSKENVYKEAVGDPKYLEESKFSGIYKGGDYTLYVYQINDKEVQVDLDNKEISFSEKFTIKSDTLLTSDSFFKEGEVEYELVFKDKTFTLKCHEEVFGFDEDTKKLALEYTYEKALTQDEILNKFYKEY